MDRPRPSFTTTNSRKYTRGEVTEENTNLTPSLHHTDNKDTVPQTPEEMVTDKAWLGMRVRDGTTSLVSDWNVKPFNTSGLKKPTILQAQPIVHRKRQ